LTNDGGGPRSRTADPVLEQILDTGIVAIARLPSADQAAGIARALQAGGVSCLEITLNTPGALHGIAQIAKLGEKFVVGAGTILDETSARQAILAGARFLVTPCVTPAVARAAKRYGCVALIGALTPTEILSAWEAGADLVKVFPASVFGPEYIRAVRGPLPQVRLAPTGGIDVENAAEFIRAGADVLCVGGTLIDSQAVATGRWDVLEARAREFTARVLQGRADRAK